ncbi:hypothetical protein EGW08_004344, partial [Elysia chlorotica]
MQSSYISLVLVVCVQQSSTQPALFQSGISRRQQQLLLQQQLQQQGFQQQQQQQQQTNEQSELSEQQQQLFLQQQQYQQLQRQLQEQRQRQKQQQELQRLQEQRRLQEQQRRQQQEKEQQQQQQRQQQQAPPAMDNFGADPGCKDPWTTEWTRDPEDCTMVHFCIQGKQQWTINCNDTRVWSNVGHACVEPMSQWDDCNQVMTTPTLNDVRCANEPNGMNPDPANCAQFVACVNMTVVATMECPTNTLFSTRNSTCTSATFYLQPYVLFPTYFLTATASPIVDKPCEGTSNGDVEDPSHCGRF